MMDEPKPLSLDDTRVIAPALALAQAVVGVFDPRNEVGSGAKAEIETWYTAVKCATALWRWTAADENSARAIVEKLGYCELARRLTGPEIVVLLALIPQLHSIAHHGPSLARALRRWLGVPVRFVPHVSRYRDVPEGDRSLLKERYSRLGIDMVLGASLFEHGSTIGLEVDLRADGAAPRVLASDWVATEGTTMRPTSKLLALSEALIPAALRVEWRFLLPPVKEVQSWRLGRGWLGCNTRLGRRPSDIDA